MVDEPHERRCIKHHRTECSAPSPPAWRESVAGTIETAIETKDLIYSLLNIIQPKMAINTGIGQNTAEFQRSPHGSAIILLRSRSTLRVRHYLHSLY